MDDPLERLFSRKIYQGSAGEVWIAGHGSNAVYYAKLNRYGQRELTYRELEARYQQDDVDSVTRKLAMELLAEATK